MCIRNNMNLGFINAYTKFYQNSSIWSEDIEKKQFVIVLTYILSISMHLQNSIKIHQLVNKILSIKEILTSIKGHNSVENEGKILFNRPNLHLVNIMHIQNLIEIHKLIHKILSINKILASIKGHNSVKNWPKIACIQHGSCIYQCIYKILSKFIHLIWRYWGKTHFYINQES